MRQSPVHGKGVFALQPIPAGTQVAEYKGQLITAKQAETRAKRIRGACDMLAKGKRRVCCFDRSGFYSKQFSAPQVAK